MSRVNFRQPLVIIDCEMSGPDPNKHQLLEIAALRCDPKNFGVGRCDVFHLFVGPEEGRAVKNIIMDADPAAICKNGIDIAFHEHYLSPTRAIFRLCNFLEQTKTWVWVGYDMLLDYMFLHPYMRNIPFRKIDVKTLADVYFHTKEKEVSSLSLSSVGKYFGVDVKEAHSAKADCAIIKEVLPILLSELG